MKRTKGVLAMEGLEALTTLPTPLAEICAEVETSAGDVLTQIDNVQEGEAIAETVNAIDAVIDLSVQRGQGLDDVAARITNAALENFYHRLGYKPVLGRGKVALEGLGTPESRLAVTKVALEQIGQFRTQLVKSLKIAREAMEAAVDEHLDEASDTASDMAKHAKSAASAFKSKGKAEELIAGGNWAAPLGVFKEGITTSEEVCERLKEIKDKLEGVSISSVVAGTADADGMKKFQNAVKDVAQLTSGDGVAEAQFSPLDPKDLDAIVNFNAAFAADVQALGKDAGDKKKEDGKDEEKADETVLRDLVTLSAILTKLVTAICEYIERSTAK